MLGDGSYLMMNSEIATSVMLGHKLTIVVLDNRGFGCINRLQRATGGESFNNLLEIREHEALPAIDFVAHAASLGAIAVKVEAIADSRPRSTTARRAKRRRSSSSTPIRWDSTDAGGIGGTSRCRKSPCARKSRAAPRYEDALKTLQRIGD